METFDCVMSGTDSSGDCLKTNRSISDLPEVVFEYILSYLSPYRQLIDCKLVSKSWRLSVIETITKLKRDFVQSLSTQSVEWSHLRPQQSGPSISPRYSHSACCFGDSLYVFGGCTIANTTFNDLWRFDLSSRSWIRPLATGQFPTPKACASLVEYNNNLVLFGGWTHSSPYPIHQEWKLFNNIHLFDTTTNKWILVSPNSNCPAIAGHSASVVGHHMIVFGGLQSQANNRLPFSSTNDIWVLNLKDYNWHKQSTGAQPKPLPRYGHSQVVIDSRHILIIGGSGGPNMLFSDIWMLSIPEDMSSKWFWKPIDVVNKDPNLWPQISFHPTCKIGNLLTVLSVTQKVRTIQCKDGNILRKPSIRSQYVSSFNETDGNTSASTSKLMVQPSYGSSSSQVPQTSPNSSRLSSRQKNRQRQLEGLNRMEQRIRQLKANTSSLPIGITSSTIRSSNIDSTQSPMQLFVLDISQVVDRNVVKWIQKTHFISEGPEEVILYSLVAGRAEMIMFGGIQKDKNMRQQNQNENSVPTNVTDIVSNQLHIITAKRTII